MIYVVECWGGSRALIVRLYISTNARGGLLHFPRTRIQTFPNKTKTQQKQVSNSSPLFFVVLRSMDQLLCASYPRIKQETPFSSLLPVSSFAHTDFSFPFFPSPILTPGDHMNHPINETTNESACAINEGSEATETARAINEGNEASPTTTRIQIRAIGDRNDPVSLDVSTASILCQPGPQADFQLLTRFLPVPTRQWKPFRFRWRASFL